MAANTQRITLAHTQRAWRIVRVTNSTAFTPGEYLEKPEVDLHCDSAEWDVTIQEK